MHKEINVHLKNTINCSYPVIVRPGSLDSVQEFVLRRVNDPGVFVITDSNVARLVGRRLQTRLLAVGVESLLLVFPAGEGSKNAKVVYALQSQLLAHRIRRDSLIIALGGGVVGDVAGFVAATVLRGVPYAQVPTTLLSQVDSSVGGKVGIDHNLGKNLIGAFHQPVAVFIDPNVLQTLPQREFRSGLAEAVKIAAALDGKFFSFLEQNVHRIGRSNSALLSEIIFRAVKLKAAVVEKDEFERSLRKALNLGHTVGHAVEAATGFSIRHGEAAAIGIVVESMIAVRLGLLQEEDFLRVRNLLNILRLPTRMPKEINRKKFYAALSTDKKSEGNRMKFSLLCGVGSTAIGVDVPAAYIEQALTM
jgi:3-dehydroquinate synthase